MKGLIGIIILVVIIVIAYNKFGKKHVEGTEENKDTVAHKYAQS